MSEMYDYYVTHDSNETEMMQTSILFLLKLETSVHIHVSRFFGFKSFGLSLKAS